MGFMPRSSCGQQEELKPAQVNALRWEKAKKGRDYAEVAKENKDALEISDINAPSWSFHWLKYVLIGLLIAFLVFLLIKVLSKEGNKNLAKDQRIIEDLARADEDLANTDLEAILKRALVMKDHRLALRIRYLMLLKELDTLGLIKHRKDKTNMTYVLELSDKKEQLPFQKLTHIFEFIWYGDHSISEVHYSELDTLFISITESLDKP